MEEITADCKKEIINKFQVYFLSCLPLKCIRWKDVKNLNWEEQKQLMDVTVAHKLNQQLPVKIHYQIHFLKRLIQEMEEHNVEIHDEIYERCCELQKRLAHNNTHKFAYKHYVLLNRNVHFTLRESISFVIDGTTGLCSWQASLVLANYLLYHSELVHNKHVLELGSGTGLCGFILLRCCGVKRMLLTDGSDQCISSMHGNLVRNFNTAKECIPGIYSIDEQTLAILQLPWNSIQYHERTLKTFETDVLLAADVIYDDSVFEELSLAIDFVFKSAKKSMIMILAATIRNIDTLEQFVCVLENMHYDVRKLHDIPEDECELPWDRTTPVYLFKITS